MAGKIKRSESDIIMIVRATLSVKSETGKAIPWGIGYSLGTFVRYNIPRAMNTFSRYRTGRAGQEARAELVLQVCSQMQWYRPAGGQ